MTSKTTPTREQIRLWMNGRPGSREHRAMRSFVRCLAGRDREDLWRPFLVELELGVFGVLDHRYEEEKEEILGKLWHHLLDPEHAWLRQFLEQSPARKCFAFFVADRLRDLLREEYRKTARRAALLAEHCRSLDPGTYLRTASGRRSIVAMPEPRATSLVRERLVASVEGTERGVLEDLLRGLPLWEIARRRSRCERAVRAALARLLRRVERIEGEPA